MGARRDERRGICARLVQGGRSIVLDEWDGGKDGVGE